MGKRISVRAALSSWRLIAALTLVAGCRLNFDPREHDDGDDDGNDDGVDRAVIDAPQIDPATGPEIAANVVFVTSEKYSVTTIAGLDGADAICAMHAAGLWNGTFVAWLSTPTIDARDRLAGARGWVRPDGRPFADTVDDLTAGVIFFPPSIDETGTETPSSISVATGTLETGVASANTCSGWTSIAGFGEGGRTLRSATEWTSLGGAIPCTDQRALYCFGTDRSDAVAPPPIAPGDRRAFVTSAVWIPGGGRDAADQLCQSESAGLGGTFRALIATSSESATARFDLSGPIWKRLDGVTLATSTADFAAGELLAPLDRTPAGATLATGTVVNGAISPDSVGSGGSTCLDWTSASRTDSFYAGNPRAADYQAFGYSPAADCNVGGHLYCLEL